jgi:hypothetical protein
LIIDPRNNLEHQYTVTDEVEARHAVEIADLFEKATRPFTITSNERFAFERPILFGDINGMESGYNEKEGTYYRLTAKPRGPLLFVDCEGDPKAVYILDFATEEALRSKLTSFSESDAVEFAKWSMSPRGSWSAGLESFRCIKAELGLSQSTW